MGGREETWRGHNPARRARWARQLSRLPPAPKHSPDASPACSHSTFLPCLVGWINRFFFWLLFTRKKENSNLSHRILTYECRFKQHVQDWAIPR